MVAQNNAGDAFSLGELVCHADLCPCQSSAIQAVQARWPGITKKRAIAVCFVEGKRCQQRTTVECARNFGSDTGPYGLAQLAEKISEGDRAVADQVLRLWGIR